MSTYIKGVKIAEAGAHLLPIHQERIINHFNCQPIQPEQIKVKEQIGKRLRVITVIDGELVTGMTNEVASINDGNAVADPERDLLKMVVINRYNPSPPAIAFVKGMQLQRGAIASSVAHDSHNVVVVGTDDESICKVANAVIAAQGGIAAGRDEYLEVLPLPVAGIMTNERGPKVAARYSEISGFAKRKLRCGLEAPFMTLSFLALLVIPKLKLSDRGLFDGEQFDFVDLWID